MAEEWFTYQELGDRLGVSPEAARQKAIRGHWPRRTANDGKAQIRVDVEDVKASTPVRKSKDEQASDDSSDTRPTPDEQAFDGQTFAALEAHIETLKGMAARAEAIANLERERATGEQARADKERDRADAERARTDTLLSEIDDVRREADVKRVAFEQDLVALKNIVQGLSRPWWKRFAS